MPVCTVLVPSALESVVPVRSVNLLFTLHYIRPLCKVDFRVNFIRVDDRYSDVRDSHFYYPAGAGYSAGYPAG